MSQPQISIITAVHNALAMNRLFWTMLRSNTTCPFELIIVDNASSDGSDAFYRELSETTKGTDQTVLYHRSETNQGYAASQNQGIRSAHSDVLCFLNNDIWLPKGWNRRFCDELAANPLVVLSPAGQEAQLYQKHSDRLKLKWKICWQLSRWAKVLGWSEEKRLWK